MPASRPTGIPSRLTRVTALCDNTRTAMDTERSATTPVDPRIRMQKEGLYDPSFEHASCGVGFVVNVDGRRTHQIVSHGITILKNLVHRGAVGGDSRTGDGAGMLTQVPHRIPSSPMTTWPSCAPWMWAATVPA